MRSILNTVAIMATLLLLAACLSNVNVRPPEAGSPKASNQVLSGSSASTDNPCAEKDPVTRLCK